MFSHYFMDTYFLKFNMIMVMLISYYNFRCLFKVIVKINSVLSTKSNLKTMSRFTKII